LSKFHDVVLAYSTAKSLITNEKSGNSPLDGNFPVHLSIKRLNLAYVSAEAVP